MIEKEIKLQQNCDSILLCRTEAIKGNKNVFMIAITEKQEEEIDNCKNIIIKYKNQDILIDSSDIYLYGEIDFDNENDINEIKRLNLIDSDGSWIHSNFNYDKGSFTTIDGKSKGYQTTNALQRFKYCHCIIGKPNRILVYRNNKVNKKCR